MTIAESAIAEIKRRMDVSKPRPKPKVKTGYMIAEQTEDDIFRDNWKAAKIYFEQLGVKKMRIRDKIIENGVKNLHEFGYPKCDKSSILTDPIYKAFFTSMLNDNAGLDKQVDLVITELLKELK